MKNQKLFFNCKSSSAININGIKNYTLIPLGNRCSSALAIQYASLRHMSLPFDWVLKLFPRRIKNVLENNFQDFIPDVHKNQFYNKYGFKLAHFNKNIDEGIEQYKRRIERLKKILQHENKIYFVYINEDYLYNKDYRDKKFNDDIFSQMVELELYLKKTYPKINYNILFFNFFENKIPKDSNIINIVLHTSKIYDEVLNSPFPQLRMYCAKILTIIFKTKLNPHFHESMFN